VFVTIGGAGSSHCLATATHAKAQGYRTAVALFAQPETEASRAVAAATAATANLVVSASWLVHAAGGRCCGRGARRIIWDAEAHAGFREAARIRTP